MNIKPLIAAAVLSCACAATPVFAQSSATKAEDYAKDKATEKVKEVVKDKMKDEAAKMVAPEGAMVKDAMKDQADKMIDPVNVPAQDGMMIKGEMMKAPTQGDAVIEGAPMMIKPLQPGMAPAPVTAPAVNPVPQIACPAGTTAQPNGTCMITGDYRG